MNPIEKEGASENEVLLKQYEQTWQRIQHYDTSYTQAGLLYMVLIAAYIGSFDKITGNSILISFCLALVSICIIGTIWRLRKLIDQQRYVLSTIEELTSMQSSPRIRGLGVIRTSTYLVTIIAIMTVLAIVLTLSK